MPPKCDQQLDDAALIERLSVIYSKEHVAMVSENLAMLSSTTYKQGREAYHKLRETYTRRMWDLGLFMKTLKQRFCHCSAQTLRSAVFSSENWTLECAA